MAEQPKLRLYNTLTRQKEDFTPLDASNVRMYVCGPTVYDFAHIGNARPVIVFDVLYRLLRHLYGEQHVTYVRNITDIDDKINKRAFERWTKQRPLLDEVKALTDVTAKQYEDDVAALGCLPPTHTPRATDFVCDGALPMDMVRVIEKLVAKGHAYAAEGHVLFHVPSMPNYGKLSRRTLDDMIAGARVEVAPYKRDPMDFVLWKPSDPATEPGWESPWGFGRPGWHIECSAMSGALLGEQFDIHAGGIDLIFPHHENEIAQTCCAFGVEKMASVWMHNGFLQVEGQKMSKSVGNFVTINELLDSKKFGDRSWHGQLLRFVMLQTHYLQPIDWTLDKLKAAREELASISYTFNRLDVSRYKSARRLNQVPALDGDFLAALYDDLNTSEAITRIRKVAKLARKNDDLKQVLLAMLEFIGLDQVMTDLFTEMGPIRDISLAIDRLDFDQVEELRVALANGNDVRVQQIKQSIEQKGVDVEIGTLWRDIRFNVQDSAAASARAEEINTLIATRLEARRAKNFAESDRIRDELLAMGIQLKDGKNAITGAPETTWEVKR
jgi:cysteinyl-tRNA synthetase